MEIFDMELYSPEEVRDIMFRLRSMLNQIAVLAELSDEDAEELREMREVVDNFETVLGSFYNSMVKSLSKKGNKNKNKGNNRSVGRIGISSSQFN